MNGFLWLMLVCAAVWVVGALITLGVLLERERLQNEEGDRGWRWWCALVISGLGWPFLAALWPASRPVPPPQPEQGSPLPTYENTDPWRVGPGHLFHPATSAGTGVVTPRELMHVFPTVTTAYVRSHQVAVVRTQGDLWKSTSCTCVWNAQGWPQVVCRVHRSDVDPQGEPDDEDEVFPI